MAFDPYAFAYLCAARAFLDLVRHDSLHAASADDALAAYALADNRIAGELVDDRDHRSILLFDVWRPELTEEERALVTAMFEALDAQGEGGSAWHV